MAQDLTVAQLLQRGLCTAQCITSSGTDTEHCSCSPCARGEHGELLHGAIAGFRVPGTACLVPPPAESAGPPVGEGDLFEHADFDVTTLAAS